MYFISPFEVPKIICLWLELSSLAVIWYSVTFSNFLTKTPLVIDQTTIDLCIITFNSKLISLYINESISLSSTFSGL